MAANLEQIFNEDTVHAVLSHRAFLEFDLRISSMFGPILGVIQTDYLVFMVSTASAWFVQNQNSSKSVLPCFEYVHSILCAYALVWPFDTKRRYISMVIRMSVMASWASP